MFELIAGAAFGIYAYKKVNTVRTFVDKYMIQNIKTLGEKYYSNRYKIVKFSDDSYAIRKRNLTGYVYFDLETKYHWWSVDENYFSDAKGTLKQCRKTLEQFFSVGGKESVKEMESAKYGKPVDD